MTVLKNIPYWLFGLLLVLVLGCDSNAVEAEMKEDIEEEILPLLFEPTVYTSAVLSGVALEFYNELEINPKVADLSIVRISDHWSLFEQPEIAIQIPNGPRLIAITQNVRYPGVGYEWTGHIQTNEGEGFALLRGNVRVRGFIWANDTGYSINGTGTDSGFHIVYRSVDEDAKSTTLPLLFEPTVYSPSDLSEAPLARYNKFIDRPDVIDVFIIKVSQAQLTLQYPKLILNLPNGIRLTATTQGFTPIGTGGISWLGRAGICSGGVNKSMTGGSEGLFGTINICGTMYFIQPIGDNMHIVHRTQFVSCECDDFPDQS